jgi:hypothetical protein
MKGNQIIVTGEPKGRFSMGYIASGETPKPGTIMQIQAATALKHGLHTYEIYNADADGGRPKGPIFVLDGDWMQGKSADDAYAAGDLARLYTPLPGDDLNLLLLNLSGTADDHALGEMLIIDDTTGKFIATTGSPETECAQLLETVTDPEADTLAWCIWTGY